MEFKKWFISAGVHIFYNEMIPYQAIYMLISKNNVPDNLFGVGVYANTKYIQENDGVLHGEYLHWKLQAAYISCIYVLIC